MSGKGVSGTVDRGTNPARVSVMLPTKFIVDGITVWAVSYDRAVALVRGGK